MDSETGGLSSAERQRQTAAEIARKKVLAAYSSTPGKMKDTPTTQAQVSKEEWQKYHSAWQNYYQKYYSEYYSNAARQYVATEKLKAERAKAEEPEVLPKAAEAQKSTEQTEQPAVESTLRQKIRERATDQARKTRKRKHLVPIFAGVAVVIAILFLQYNRLIFAPIAAYVSPGDAPASEITAVDPTVSQTVSADPKLIIPKINVEVPVSFGISNSEVMEAMKYGVAHYIIPGATAYPGQIGNLVITGHSAGDIYSNYQYKYIFSGLERLSEGDLIYINYNSARYTYSITKKSVVEPTEVSALTQDTDKPMLILVTCTPLGTSKYRLLVYAEQISPTYEGAPSTEPIASDDEDEDVEELPSNEPSFFERIWNFLTNN